MELSSSHGSEIDILFFIFAVRARKARRAPALEPGGSVVRIKDPRLARGKPEA
jgi:hypothetical protein